MSENENGNVQKNDRTEVKYRGRMRVYHIKKVL